MLLEMLNAIGEIGMKSIGLNAMIKTRHSACETGGHVGFSLYRKLMFKYMRF